MTCKCIQHSSMLSKNAHVSFTTTADAQREQLDPPLKGGPYDRVLVGVLGEVCLLDMLYGLLGSCSGLGHSLKRPLTIAFG
eukprot:1158359-Pelagomonas_calceolata.AAC.7